jgi:hypothetical protein
MEEEFEDMRQLLRNIGEVQETDINIETRPSTSQTRGEHEAREQDTVQIIP